MPVPSDFDMRRPSAAWIVEWMYTSVKGMSPANSMPVKIIRATQRLMMSRAVESTLPGYHVRSSGVSSGQPSVANGHSADENHVSSTSVDCSQPSPSGRSACTT